MADSINTKAKEYYDSDNSGGSLNSNLKDFLKSQGVSGTSLNTMWRNYAKDNGGESLNTRLGQLWGTSGSLISRWHKQLGLVWDDMKLFFDFRNIREQVSHPSAGSTSFDGDDYVDVGNVGNIKSLSFWVKADDITSHTDYAIDLNGTDYIKIVNGTVTLNGFAGGTNTIYVDSIVSSTLSNVNQWYYVSITSDTNRNASDFDIGRVESVGFFKGSLGNVSVDTGTLTQSQIQSIMYKSYSDLTSSEKTNLVSWWGLDTDYTDSHGSNDGTNSGSTINSTVYGDNAPKKPRIADSAPDSVANYGTLYSGTALSFDGTNDYVTIPHSSSYKPTTAISVSVWYNPTTHQNWGKIFSVPYALSGWTSPYFSFALSSSDSTSGKPSFGLATSNYNYATATTAMNTGQWYYIVGTYDGTNIKIYVNGVLEATTAETGLINYPVDAISTIGQRGTYSAGEYTNGKNSSPKIFDVALTEAQIQELYLNPEQILPTGVSSSNLKLWLPFQEGTGTTAYDGSGNNNDGTITGATWSTANTDIPQTALIRSNVRDVLGSEIVTNGTLDTDTDWDKLNDTTIANGVGSVITNGHTSSTFTNWSLSQSFSPVVGQKYRITFKAKLISGYNNCQSGFGYSSTFSQAITSEFVEYSYEYTAIHSSWNKIVFGGSAVGSVIEIDDVSVKKITTEDAFLPEGLTSGQDIQGVALTNTDENVLTLNGVEYVEVSDSDSLDFGTGDFSVECWFKTSMSSGNGTLVCKANGDGSTMTGFNIDIRGGNDLLIQAGDGTSRMSDTGGGDFSDGAWHHLVVVFDRSSGIIKYVDDSAVGTQSGTFGTNSINVSNILAIGYAEYSDDEFYTGEIDDVRIYSDALSADEVSKNYSAGLSKHS